MKKIAIFNVGGAFSTYFELDERNGVIDLGKDEGFNPVLDFLLPLAKERDFRRSKEKPEKYALSQAFLSHLDNDHISSIEDFDEYFCPDYLTTPSDHPHQNPIFRIVRSFFDKENKNVQKVLHLMSPEGGRTPGHRFGDPEENANRPLVVNYDLQEFAKLYYIPPQVSQLHEKLKDQYSNNLSLVLLFEINGYRVFFTGDITDNGLNYLIETEKGLKRSLVERGVDFLIAPHHGLATTFPNSFFSVVKGGKVKLNIISEKKGVKAETDNRSDVDGRYSSPDFATGYRILNGLKDFQYSIMTSNALNTHILLDFGNHQPIVKRCTTEELLSEFS